MRPNVTILRSTVARRILLVFLLCALLPISILKVVSFRSVSRELEEQSAIRLRRMAKSQLMAIVERLELLSAELSVVAARLPSTAPGDASSLFAGEVALTRDRLLGLELRPAAVETVAPPPASAGSARGAVPTSLGHGLLEADGAILIVEAGQEGRARFFLSQRVEASGRRQQLVAEINPLFLFWGSTLENNLPPASELFILDAARQVVLFSSAAPGDLPAKLAERSEDLGEITWRRDDSELLSSYRTANLRASYGIPGLTVAVSQEKEYLLGPLADFRRSFPPLVVASLGIVLLLSIGQIRRRLDPLQRLQAGTRRIAERDFAARVEIETGDEFEQLAGDFNSMASRLGKQFGALHSLNEIVQAVLSSLDRKEIVRASLGTFSSLLPCEVFSVTLCGGSPTSARVHRPSPNTEEGIETIPVETNEEELELLRQNPRLLLLDAASSTPFFLEGAAVPGVGTVAVFPIFTEGRFEGMISAGFATGTTPAQDDLGRVRQLADQMAVAFSNSQLLEQLERLSQGTLTALARSIDAKSHWTAGHSERVARMAVAVGRHLGLEDTDLDILERGSLLHDLGKIGVPSRILDKPGRLTASELGIVREHVRIGARILEPIAQLAPLMPLVRQHHEWLDGTGYPDGLTGDEIDPLVRILSVVDVYDALRSPRPYRDAVGHDAILEELEKFAGSQFAPDAVEAFIMSEAWLAGWTEPARLSAEPRLREPAS